MLCGAPASGKTTYARRLAAKHGYVVCSRDVVRRELRAKNSDATEDEVFSEFVRQIIAELRQRRSVVADATFSNQDRRSELLAHVVANDLTPEVELHHLRVSLAECQRRNAARPEAERVPPGDVERLYQAVQSSLSMRPPRCPVVVVPS